MKRTSRRYPNNRKHLRPDASANSDSHRFGVILLNIAASCLAVISLEATAVATECSSVAPPEWPRSRTYEQFPFKAGEEAKYALEYSGIHVGYGFLRVKKPIKQDILVGTNQGKPLTKSLWHMQFHGEVYTGDWYNAIFQGHDVIQAFSRPWNFAISQFYIRQNEKKALSDPVQKEKWLTFVQQACRVYEKSIDHSKNKKANKELPIHFGSVDVLGAAHKLRTFKYKINQSVKFEVYSSEKNWMIDALPVTNETVTLKAGTFKADKIKLTTFIGRELQARGDIFVWIASEHPNRPIVKITAEVQVGSFALYLESFKPGA